MNIIPQSIPDVLLVEPKVLGDDRGYFMETFRQDFFLKATGYPVVFIQDNESRSTKGVLRGLHYQLAPAAQSKLVRVIQGEVFDVAVDIRKGSPTYGKYVGVVLSGENKKQLFIPRGFAHGFVVLSDEAIFSYKVDNYYSPENDCGIAFDDPDINIDWQLPLEHLKLSHKDMCQPKLENLTKVFEFGKNYYE